MPKVLVAAAATADDPAVQEYHRTIRAVGAQSMRELDKLDHVDLRKRATAKAKQGASSRKPPPLAEDPDTDERPSVG